MKIPNLCKKKENNAMGLHVPITQVQKQQSKAILIPSLSPHSVTPQARLF